MKARRALEILCKSVKTYRRLSKERVAQYEREAEQETSEAHQQVAREMAAFQRGFLCQAKLIDEQIAELLRRLPVATLRR